MRQHKGRDYQNKAGTKTQTANQTLAGHDSHQRLKAYFLGCRTVVKLAAR